MGLLEALLCRRPDLTLQSRLMEFHCLWYVCEKVLAGIMLVIKRLPAAHSLELVT